MSAGYSGTPLAKKLGIKEGSRVGLQNAPPALEKTLGPLPEGVEIGPADGGRQRDVLVLFARSARELATGLPRLKKKMAPETALWVCWPKKSSVLASPDLTETVVRARGLGAGLVDVKICAVDEDWSGLKFVYRLADRPAPPKKKTKKK